MFVYGHIVENKEIKPCGYFPAGKNWYVRFSEIDDNGKMTGIIIQDCIEIAMREIPSTVEELQYFADAYMVAKEA